MSNKKQNFQLVRLTIERFLRSVLVHRLRHVCHDIELDNALAYALE